MKRTRSNALRLVELKVTNAGNSDITRLGRTFRSGTTTVVRVPRARALEIAAHASLDCTETE